jgi:hypothetical protein
MFFIINICYFSGATLSSGFSLKSSTKRFTTTSIERISKLNIDHLTITNNNCNYIKDLYKNY